MVHEIIIGSEGHRVSIFKKECLVRGDGVNVKIWLLFGSSPAAEWNEILALGPFVARRMVHVSSRAGPHGGSRGHSQGS